MATYYVDLENGNDANNGTTFALRKKTISSLAGSAGDEIRVMASPAATSLGQTATWNNKAMTTLSISSSTNATPISITTSAAHGFSTGDTVMINGHTTNTNANGTWKITVTGSTTFTLNTSVGTATGSGGQVYNITGKVVELSSAVTQTIASTGGSGSPGGNRPAWTGVTNSTVTQVTGTGVSKEGHACEQFAVNATFTTGKIAYRTLPSTLNLSGYQQVSFWVQQTSGTLASVDNLRLRLCSDTLGDTVVNTINVPAFGALNIWYPITVNLGTALGSSIASVSFALTSDQGAQTFRVANIFASKAASADDSLTLQSVIGKNDGVWYHIQSIDGTRVVIDLGSTSTMAGTTLRPRYVGTQETVTTYKKETIKVATAVLPPTGNGTAGNLLTVTGGWNRTDMTTQTDETWVDGQYRSSVVANISSKNYLGMSNFSLSRGQTQNLSFTSNTYGDYDFNTITCGTASYAIDVSANNVGNVFSVANLEFNTGSGFNSAAVTNKSNSYAFGRVAANTDRGIYIHDVGSTVTSIGSIESNINSGIEVGGSNITFESITSIKNNGAGVTMSTAVGSGANTRFENIGTLDSNGLTAFNGVGNAPIYVANGSTTGHTGQCVYAFGNAPTYFKNVTFNESNTIWLFRSYFMGESNFVMDNNGGSDYLVTEYGYIKSGTDVVHTAGGKSWQFYPTNILRNQHYPLRLSVAQAAVAANTQVTVSAWLRRTNTNLKMRLQVLGGQLAGVNKTSSDITAAADTWEQVTITFTPTEAGVIDIQCIAWTESATTYVGYIDDISITQA